MQSADARMDRRTTWALTSAYYEPIHHMLKPAVSRGLLGYDVDCEWLLRAMTAPGAMVGVAQEGGCSCCQLSGLTCIAAVKESKWWPHEPYATNRCLNCTLAGAPCDILLRTMTAMCTCDWLIPPQDREMLALRLTLGRRAAVQAGLPYRKRVHYEGKGLVPHLKKWFGDKLDSALDNFLTPPQVSSIATLLGKGSLWRDDGHWLVPTYTVACPCEHDAHDEKMHRHIREWLWEMEKRHRYEQLRREKGGDYHEEGDEGEGDDDGEDEGAEGLAGAEGHDDGYDGEDAWDHANGSSATDVSRFEELTDETLRVSEAEEAGGDKEACCGAL